jgi:hypothetical protein
MNPQAERSTQEVLAGLVERVTYHNAENGFCVLRAKARGHREMVTVVGHAATIAAGEWIAASGEWVNDRTHGQQFKSAVLAHLAPDLGRWHRGSTLGDLSDTSSDPRIEDKFRPKFRIGFDHFVQSLLDCALRMRAAIDRRQEQRNGRHIEASREGRLASVAFAMRQQEGIGSHRSRTV